MNRHSPKPNECHRCKSRNELRGVVVAALKLITLLRSGIAAVASDHTITYDHHCYRLHGTDISIHSGSIHMVLGGTNVGYWGASSMSTSYWNRPPLKCPLDEPGGLTEAYSTVKLIGQERSQPSSVRRPGLGVHQQPVRAEE